MKLEANLLNHHQYKTHYSSAPFSMLNYNFKRELFYYVNDPCLWFKSYQQINAVNDRAKNFIGLLPELVMLWCPSVKKYLSVITNYRFLVWTTCLL